MPKPTPCRSCGKAIVFLKSARGKFIPVNAETVREGDETFMPIREEQVGHISHFADCPEAGRWRKPKMKMEGKR